jgi:hypothetical protein
MACESALGIMKHINKIMGTGSHARMAARANACSSKTWEVFKIIPLQERAAILKVARKLGKDKGYMDEQDELNQLKHDEAEAERVFRVVRKWAKELAVDYANAIFLHSCRLWKSSEITAELDSAMFQYRKIEQVEEQMLIITMGGGGL